MKIEKPEDRLLDLYGISKSEAKMYWSATTYRSVLSDKIEKSKKLQAKLLLAPMLQREQGRIERIGKAIAHNYGLLKEIE